MSPPTGKKKRRETDRAVSKAEEEAREQPLDTMIRRSQVTPAASLINVRIEPSPLVSEPGPEGPRRLRTQTLEPYDQQANSEPFVEGAANNLAKSPRLGLRPRHKDAGHFDQSEALGANPGEVAEPTHAHQRLKIPSPIPVMQRNKLPLTPLRRAFAEPAIAGEVLPTISVTIGRVDVRAVFAQPQANRSDRPKKSAAMSLDDYLKQQTGGRP